MYTICTIISVVFRCLRVVLYVVVTYDQFIQKSKQIHRVKKNSPLWTAMVNMTPFEITSYWREILEGKKDLKAR